MNASSPHSRVSRLVLDSRGFAIVRAAIHDAVNGVERRHQPYTIELSSPTASVALLEALQHQA